MGIQRKLPDSDKKRKVALDTTKIKKDNTVPADVIITPATIARLDATQPVFKEKMQKRDDALAAQGGATTAKNLAMEESRMYNSHFIQVFNLGVERGDFPKEHRAFYHLDINSNSVPLQNTEAEVTQLGEWLVEGDPRRITAGGDPMAMPTIAQVTTKYDVFISANATQSTLKDAFDAAQEVVSGMREEVDALILRIWNEVETAFDNEPIESRRRNAREWGIVYASTKKAKITGLVTNSATGEPLENVNVSIVEIGDTVQTGADGKYILITDFTGEGTLEFALVDFVTQTFPVTIDEGASFVQDVQLLHV